MTAPAFVRIEHRRRNNPQRLVPEIPADDQLEIAHRHVVALRMALASMIDASILLHDETFRRLGNDNMPHQATAVYRNARRHAIDTMTATRPATQ